MQIQHAILEVLINHEKGLWFSFLCDGVKGKGFTDNREIQHANKELVGKGYVVWEKTGYHITNEGRVAYLSGEYNAGVETAAAEETSSN